MAEKREMSLLDDVLPLFRLFVSRLFSNSSLLESVQHRIEEIPFIQRRQ